MQMFIKNEGYELWNIVTKGLYVPMTTVDGQAVNKTEEQYTEEDFQDSQKKLCISYMAV